MRELLVRTAGPALLVIVEVEGPVRISSVVTGDERDRLLEWITAEPALVRLYADALLAREAGGGERRARQWATRLQADGGGIVAHAQELLAELLAAEGAARKHPAGVIERLRARLRRPSRGGGP